MERDIYSCEKLIRPEGEDKRYAVFYLAEERDEDGTINHSDKRPRSAGTKHAPDWCDTERYRQNYDDQPDRQDVVDKIAE
ncbi:MAG: hypothetical protein P8X76_16300 [Maritimibacter sp.]